MRLSTRIFLSVLNLFWNNGGPIALKNVLVPFFMTTFYSGTRLYQTGYVFGVRIFRFQVSSA